MWAGGLLLLALGLFGGVKGSSEFFWPPGAGGSPGLSPAAGNSGEVAGADAAGEATGKPEETIGWAWIALAAWAVRLLWLLRPRSPRRKVRAQEKEGEEEEPQEEGHARVTTLATTPGVARGTLASVPAWRCAPQ